MTYPENKTSQITTLIKQTLKSVFLYKLTKNFMNFFDITPRGVISNLCDFTVIIQRGWQHG